MGDVNGDSPETHKERCWERYFAEIDDCEDSFDGVNEAMADLRTCMGDA